MPRLDDVIADILPEAQNAPADVLKKAMLDAARTLCRRSKVWRVDVEGTLIPGIAQVELELPRETSVVDVAYLYTQREQLFTGRFSAAPNGTVTLADVPVDGGPWFRLSRPQRRHALTTASMTIGARLSGTVRAGF